VDTQGLVLNAKIHSAKIQDREGIKILLALPLDHLPRLGRGKFYTAENSEPTRPYTSTLTGYGRTRSAGPLSQSVLIFPQGVLFAYADALP
jgi:hypothetical protein